jgi:RNA polymerase sigma-70 factor (ECF subfamily)
MVSVCRQPGMEEGAIPALRISGGLARAETVAGSCPAGRMNASNQPEPSPEELARLSAQGSAASFEQIVLRFQSQVFNFLHVFTRHRQDAEDLTQETFCRAWRGLHRYNPSLSFAPWLFAIARHTAASHFRSAEHFDELPPEAGMVEENPANLLAIKDDADALWQLARTLKPRHWEVLWFRYGEGFSIAETARAMRINEIHVKVLLHRARGRLGQRLAARGYGPPTATKPPEPGNKSIPASEP